MNNGPENVSDNLEVVIIEDDFDEVEPDFDDVRSAFRTRNIGLDSDD